MIRIALLFFLCFRCRPHCLKRCSISLGTLRQQSNVRGFCSWVLGQNDPAIWNAPGPEMAGPSLDTCFQKSYIAE